MQAHAGAPSDVPNVDRVVFLRPSDSPVVFLQQLGRGLRAAEGKGALTVLDLVGNHAVFLRRLQALLDAMPHAHAFSPGIGADAPDSVAAWLVAARASAGQVAMPAHCTLNLELDAIDLLAAMTVAGQGTAAVALRRYRELAAAWGRRPTAGELVRLGINPRTLGGKGGDLLGFLLTEGALSAAEREAVQGPGGPLLRELQRTAMSKCFKMVLLEAMRDADGLHQGLPLADVAARSLAILRRSPELRVDLIGVRELGAPPNAAALAAVDLDRFVGYWRKNPVAAWLGESGKTTKPLLRLVDSPAGLLLRLHADVPLAQRGAFEALVAELVDWRLAEYRQRRVVAADGDTAAFSCKVLRNGQHAILKLPPRAEHPAVPKGEVDVRLPDGSVWRFRFAKEFVNVANPVGTVGNRLGGLLAGWFGAEVGVGGTVAFVGFVLGPDGWLVRPGGVEHGLLR